MIKSWLHKRRIKKIWKIHPRLIALYGNHKDYTIGQISKIAEQSRLNPKHVNFAHALYATRLCFDNEYRGEHNYWDLRRDFQNIIFGHFTYLTSKEAITSDFNEIKKFYNKDFGDRNYLPPGSFM